MIHNDQGFVPLADIFTKVSHIPEWQINIPIHPDVFRPDEWTLAFANGLTKLANENAFDGKNIVECGVGTGINMAGLHAISKPKSFIGGDINASSIRSAKDLARSMGIIADIFKSCLLMNINFSDLVETDHIIACIPQVPADPTHQNLQEGDNSSHYYIGDGSKWDLHGLGLNAKLLEQAHDWSPQARVTLNLGGRPGIDTLRAMFNEHGYKVVAIHAQRVPQCPISTVAPLASLEAGGHRDFEFFDANGGKVNAGIAEELRLSGQPVFHNIYVMTGELNSSLDL